MIWNFCCNTNENKNNNDDNNDSNNVTIYNDTRRNAIKDNT